MTAQQAADKPKQWNGVLGNHPFPLDAATPTEWAREAAYRLRHHGVSPTVEELEEVERAVGNFFEVLLAEHEMNGGE